MKRRNWIDRVLFLGGILAMATTSALWAWAWPWYVNLLAFVLVHESAFRLADWMDRRGRADGEVAFECATTDDGGVHVEFACRGDSFEMTVSPAWARTIARTLDDTAAAAEAIPAGSES